MKVVHREARIRAVDGVAVFVVNDEPALLHETLLEDLDVPFPVLVDLERRAYADWGLREATFAQIWLDPGTWRQYLEMLRGGERLRASGRHPRQLGGDFVVGPGGRLVFSRPQQRDDRPPAGRLVEHLETSVDR